MAMAEPTSTNMDSLNIDFMRNLVKQYSELGQWTSALFWADAAAAAGNGNGTASGDDIWLLASVMLARGELHRAAHAVTSRGLHRRHLLCLGVAMRAYLTAREPATALTMMEECDPALLEPRPTDQTHNRALGSVLVWSARALWALERREAGAAALCAGLRADAACYEALDLLLDRHALTPQQESELVESLGVNNQLSPAEAALVRAAYRERLNRYAPAADPTPTDDCPLSSEVEVVRTRTSEAMICRARRLAAGCEWTAALKLLDAVDPWCCGDVRAACLVELRRSSELFAFAHTLVDAYPNSWISWYAVGCYYYLIGKSEFARRYLSKAKGLEPGAGCVWLAYGHSFAADNEHDQAMAAYFKASQLMGGCHLPPLYVGVECSLLNNSAMCERFLARAAALHSNSEARLDKLVERSEGGGSAWWARLVPLAHEPHVAHEAGAAALAAHDLPAAHDLFLRALDTARGDRDISQVRHRPALAAHEPHVAHEAGAAALAAHDLPAAHDLFLRALDTARGDRDISQVRHRPALAAHEPHVAHEAGAAALAAHDLPAAHDLFLRALDTARGDRDISQVWHRLALAAHELPVNEVTSRLQLSSRWAATLDALGHTARRLGRAAEGAGWHARALGLRPARGGSLAALGLALALLARPADAAQALHAALARDPDNVVALALLDAIVDRLDVPLEDEEIPQFPFPAVSLSLRAPPADETNTSDMSMSFD